MITNQTRQCSEPSKEELRLQVEVQKLRAQIAMLKAENQILLKRISELINKLATETDKDRQLALSLELKILQDRVNQRNRTLFGRSSEKLGRPQTAEKPEKKERKQKRTGSKRTKQLSLPTAKVRHLLDVADQICPGCGGKLYAKANKFDSSERIVVSERVYTVVSDEKQVYGCGDCGHSETALAPAHLVPGGRYDSSVAIGVAVDKYVDHQPLNRQVAAMKRVGLKVSRQALWNQIDALAKLCEPSHQALHDWMLNDHKMLHADETTWRMMVKGGSTKWWLWALGANDGFFCLAMPTRGVKAARQLLRNFDGALMSDAYIVYKMLAKEGKQAPLELSDERPWQPRFEMFVCWSHARRRFEQAAKHEDEALPVLGYIAELYAIESRAKEKSGGDEEKNHQLRSALRGQESTLVIDKINRWRQKQLALPGTKFAEGLTFLDNQWQELTGFLHNPLVPLDNNLIERQVRTPVLGRKNHLGSHSERGAYVSALFYSLLGSCRLVDVSPSAYLQTLVKRCLQDKAYVLLPHEFAAELAAA
jgi:transposase